MKKRIKLASKRRVIVFMLVASMILSIPVSAEYWFKFVIRTTTEGYNDEMGAQNKIAGYPYASVIVHHVTAAGQNVTGRRTNFIVITKNTGRQISDNVIIQDFDILPRLKPWDSLDSGSVIQPYRLKYSHCVQDLC